eukprot:TRINITY_DN9285_c0_g1_i5.p1 TRINITY_DN9285_c0_g1~~TRINITY_DN9285_c0_g1_i5.p1  ORF type:complete len:230 (+),score=35.89 TRINITY_DN9285_c0_g1_i5:79-690(+)
MYGSHQKASADQENTTVNQTYSTKSFLTNQLLFKTPSKHGLREVYNGTPIVPSTIQTKSKNQQFTPQILTKSKNELASEGQEGQELESLLGMSMEAQRLQEKEDELHEIDQKVSQMHAQLEGQLGMTRYVRYVGDLLFPPSMDPHGENFRQILECQFFEEDEDEEEDSFCGKKDKSCYINYMDIDEINLVSCLPEIQGDICFT